MNCDGVHVLATITRAVDMAPTGLIGTLHFTPDIRRNTLIGVVYEGAGLDLIEGAVLEVLLSQAPSHVVSPV